MESLAGPKPCWRLIMLEDKEPLDAQAEMAPNEEPEANGSKKNNLNNWLLIAGAVALVIFKPALAASIFLFGVLVAIHEAGHMVLAKWNGMRVDTFSIGMGPALYSFKRGETEYQLAPIPLGGYVHIVGLDPEEEGAADDPRAFDNRPLGGRILAILGGPLANYVSAGILVFILALGLGGRWTVRIGEVKAGSTAAQAGIMHGDRLLAIDGNTVEFVSDLPRQAGGAGDYLLTLRRELKLESQTPIADLPTLRDGDKVIRVLGLESLPDQVPTGLHTIEFERMMSKPAGLFGMGVGTDLLTGEDQSLSGAFVASVRVPIETTRGLALSLYQAAANPDQASVGGPVAILKMASGEASQGLLPYLLFAITLSVVLGFFNLLPIPALDGGRLVFLFLEGIHKKLTVSPLMQAKIHGYGFMGLLVLIAIITVNDVMNL